MEDIISANLEELQERYKMLLGEEAEIIDELRLIGNDINAIVEQMQMYRIGCPKAD